jgi:hypothetical protein
MGMFLLSQTPNDKYLCCVGVASGGKTPNWGYRPPAPPLRAYRVHTSLDKSENPRNPPKSPLKSYRVYTSLEKSGIGVNPPAWCASMVGKPDRSASAKSPLKRGTLTGS